MSAVDASLPPSGARWTARFVATNATVALAGDWLVAASRVDGPGAQAIFGRHEVRALSFDSSGLGRWDTSLLVFLIGLRDSAGDHGMLFETGGLPQATTRLLALVPEKPSARRDPVGRSGFVANTGAAAIAFSEEALAIVTLVGEIVLRTGAAAGGRARMRTVDLLGCMRDAGGSALPIVAIVNLLGGGILAFVGAVQLKRFGADIYVANLVGVAVVREMAALMTAIVMAGRTGGAYAAEIASMQGSEELDALRVVGIPVADCLILPRVLALTAVMPALYLYGAVIGIGGGFVVSVGMLQLAPARFVGQLLGAVSGGEIVFGLGKSVAFGALIAIAGCRMGLKAGRSASDVGRAATSAVVAGIVGVIALDAVFAVCANAVGF